MLKYIAHAVPGFDGELMVYLQEYWSKTTHACMLFRGLDAQDTADDLCTSPVLSARLLARIAKRNVSHHFVIRQDPISTIHQSAKRKLRVDSGLDKVSIDQGTEEMRKSGEPRRLYCIPLSALYSKTRPKSRRQR